MEFQPSILSFFNFDFVETQRKSFFHFLEHGIIRELDKRSRIVDSVQGLELVFYPKEYRLTTPTLTPQQALLLSKTYESQLYVPAHCIDKTNKTIQIQWVLLGSVPLITKRGHFIINGLPRVIVHQMTRSPGIYLSKKTVKKMVERQPVLIDVFSAHILPLKGSPITVHIDEKQRKCIQVNKTGKLPLVIFLRALGLTSHKIIDAFEYPEQIKNEVNKWLENTESNQILDSLVYPEKKNEKKIMLEVSRWFEHKGISTTPRALEFLYAMLSAWPASKLGKNKITFSDLMQFSKKGPEAQRLGQKFFVVRFMHPRRYDLGKVGRVRLNTKAGIRVPTNQSTLTPNDFLGVTNALLRFSLGLLPQDDIDDLANKRVQTSGELIQNQFAVGISRLEKVIRERMKKAKSSFTLRGFITAKAVNGAFREFFGSNPLSQYMDQTNPLAEITHKRRVSSLGFGGISRETATMAIRGIHPTHYGRICPIETPEGQNAGLVNSMTTFSRINSLGFFETPFFSVFQGQIQKNQGLYFFSSEREKQVNVAPADLAFSHSNLFFQNSLPIRNNQKFQRVDRKKVEFIAINPIQMISIATALIPFLEHDDANRALMGSNMQRQSISFLKAERPIVRTGLESKVVANSGQIIQASSSGFVSYSSGETIRIESALNCLSGEFEKHCKPSKKSSIFLADRSKKEKLKIESIVSQADLPINLPINITLTTRNDSNIFSFLLAKSGFKSSLTGFILQNKVCWYKASFLQSFYIEWFFQTQPTKKKNLSFNQEIATSYLKEQGLENINNNVENLIYWQRKNWRTYLKSNKEKAFSLFFDVFLQRWQFLILFQSNQVNTFLSPKLIEMQFTASPHLLKKNQKPKNFPFLNIFQKYTHLQNFLCLYDFQKKLDEGTLQLTKQSLLSLSNSIAPTTGLRKNYLIQSKNLNIQGTKVSKKIKELFLETYKSKLPFLVHNEKKLNNSSFINQSKINTAVPLQAKFFDHKSVQKTKNSCSFEQKVLTTLQYSLRGYERSNQKTYLKQRPCIVEGQWVQKGDIIADCASSVGGELALGKNIFIAYMPWEGYNFEDALLISEKLTEDDMFTSLHIERYEIEVRETKFGSEQITSNLPEIQPWQANHLDVHGIAKVGSFVKHGDILVGKVTPIKKILFSPQQKLLHDVVEKPVPNMRDTSLRVPKGIKGRVVHTTIVNSEFVFPSSLPNTSKTYKKKQSVSYITQQKTQKQNKQVAGNVTTKLQPSLKQSTPKGWYHQDSHAMYTKNTNKKPYVPNQLSNDHKRSLQINIKKSGSKTKNLAFQKLSIATSKGSEKGYDFLQKPKKVYIFLAEKQILQRGDKLAGRHGNKGIVSQILPRQDMPYLPDGTSVDIVLNPLGVPSRMNVGQIFESLLGLAGYYLDEHYTLEPFDEAYGIEASRSLAYTKLYEARKQTNQSWLFNPEFPGKMKLFDGRTGACFDQPVTVGKSYILKLVHLVDEKIHARSTGPYSLVTQQPLRGRSKQGGQRVGEMEVWAFEGFGAAYTLQELLTIKSDDTQGRFHLMDAFLTKKNLLWNASESFKVLVRELQSICLDVGLYPIGSHSIFPESLDFKLQRHIRAN